MGVLLFIYPVDGPIHHRVHVPSGGDNQDYDNLHSFKTLISFVFIDFNRVDNEFIHQVVCRFSDPF